MQEPAKTVKSSFSFLTAFAILFEYLNAILTNLQSTSCTFQKAHKVKEIYEENLCILWKVHQYFPQPLVDHEPLSILKWQAWIIESIK